MKYNKAIVFFLVALAAIPAMGQQRIDRNRMEKLIGKGLYATAYPLAQEQYRQAQELGGPELLEAAFYLTVLDYAYNSTYAVDSALMRYSLLARRLQGVDRAVAYAYLFQTYNGLYSDMFYKFSRNKPSDDPKLKYPLWHLKRMEDTLMACADSVLAYAGQLRTADRDAYGWMTADDRREPVMDSSLLGMVVQTLVAQTVHCQIFSQLADGLRSTLLLPLPEFCAQAPADSTMPYPLALHRRVGQVFADGAADVMLWFDLQRYDACYADSSFIAAIEKLTQSYAPRIKTDEMKAWLGMQRAKYLSFEQRKVEAEQVCVEMERRYPGTYGARRCQQLLYDIRLPKYTINYNVIESSKRSRMACVEARNVPWIDFKIVVQDSVASGRPTVFNLDSVMLALPAVMEWRQTLPDPGDHLTHEYLIALPAVPQGDYYLLARTDSSICHQQYVSSDATFIPYHWSAAANKHTRLSPSAGYLVDRLTGQPLANKRVTLHTTGEMSGREYRRHCRTDKEGYFHFPTSSVRYLMKDIDGISAEVDGYECWYGTFSWDMGMEYDFWERTKFVDIVMTDRPIYRLGDTVRFSCVAYRKKQSGEAWQIKLKPSSKVDLVATFGEAYGDSKDTLRLTTDKHGRCWGEFVIPVDGRNGSYALEILSADQSSWRESYRTSRNVKVEAYKPPRFMVSLSTTAGDAESDTGTVRRFGQPITVYGTATSYSGAPMTGAKVRWEVSRERPESPLQAFSVANEFPFHDSLTVDDEGLFQFTFTPEQDSGTIVYTAHVFVLDADGEMHDQHLSFRVSDADGYCALASDDLSQLTFMYNNFDHQPLKGAVRVELFQLRQPDTVRTLDPLMGEFPEARWVGTKEDFRQQFPYRAFSREEDDMNMWPVVAKRFDQTTEGRQIETSGLPSGLYRVRFTSPDGKHHETQVNYVSKGGRVTGNQVVWVRTTPKAIWQVGNIVECRVGDTVRFELGSPYGDQPLYYCISHAAKIYRKGMMVLDSSQASMLTIPITKKMTDGCVVMLSAVREGRTYTERYDLRVLRTDRQVDVNIETFRDRLQPGEREQWRLRVISADTLNGKNVRGEEANLCLAMYDKSLEQSSNQRYNAHPYGFWPWYQNFKELYSNIWLTDFRQTIGTWEGKATSMITPDKPSLALPLSVVSGYHRALLLRFNPGAVRGTIVDGKTQEPLPFVNIVLKRDGKQISGTTTDFDGYFSIGPLPAGEYIIEVSSVGYARLEKQVTVKQDVGAEWNIVLTPGATKLECVEIVSEAVPVIEIGSPESGRRITSEDIAYMPGNSVESIVAAVGGIGYDDGGTARGEDGMVTMQGGVRRRAGVAAPREAIAEILPMFRFGNSAEEAAPSMRKNMSTLALFEPALRSDKEGRVEVSFTMPDGLTQWQLHGFAWTDRFQMGQIARTLYTQKELMVQPLMPRFLRQGDTTEIRAKVSNLSDADMTVVVALEIENSQLRIEKELEVRANSSAIATYRVPVGDDWHVANYKIVARNTDASRGHLSDGEQGMLPVLSNRERITRSHLLYIAGTIDSTQAKTATFTIPFSPLTSPSDSLSVAFTANPIDYAIQALPHFKRHRMPGNMYLANSIYVNHLSSLLSPLTEKERKRAAQGVKKDLNELLRAQTSEGGWSWMPGGKTPSRHITEAILQRLTGCPSLARESYYGSYYRKALSWLDKELVNQYQSDRETTILSPISTLYTRSLYLDVKPLEKCDSITRKAYDYFYRKCKMRLRDDMPLYRQGQLALLLLHMGDTVEAVELANLIKESAHIDEQKGMYWVKNVSGYGWYQRPIETAALMVDVFADVLMDWESVNRIQQWILSSKEGTIWKTDMATAQAVAALVRAENGVWKAEGGKRATLRVNGQPFEEIEDSLNASATSHLSSLTFHLENSTPYPAWGAVFVSREAPLDSIEYDGTGISLRKTLSRVAADGSLQLLDSTSALHTGDRVRVHIDIYCERDMDNMVLSDQRAAAFEPVSTASGWCWNDGLRYYTDVRDDCVNCYIDRLDEGHYYVEYDLWVRHAGTFANGIGILRSVYAPEFRANTPSARLQIVD